MSDQTKTSPEVEKAKTEGFREGMRYAEGSRRIKPHSRRVKILHLTMGSLVDCIRYLMDPNVFFCLEPWFGNQCFEIPKDARVVGQGYDICQDAWAFVIESDIFPEIPQYAVAETLGGLGIYAMPLEREIERRIREGKIKIEVKLEEGA